ncbi:hypothetical protein T07_15147 [Trichinella nelsoni]|uniref:Uncharacterized protein n=1 Tax=Trichinella nelsoni TaxID=6336 RepID=A0A0V0S435_9BILA|nr:hypothetical protein T07_15147 [Trichinella nelsoni]
MKNLCRQVQQLERTALQTFGRVGCFSCGCLDQHRRDCSQLRVRKPTAERRTMATINPLTGSVLAVTGKIQSLNILLLVDSDEMGSVIPKRVWDKATSGQKLQGAARPMQLGDGKKMATCVPLPLTMVYDNDYQRAPALFHNKKNGTDDGKSHTTNCYCHSISQWMLNGV